MLCCSALLPTFFPSRLTSPVPGRPVDVPTLPLALDYESQRKLDTDQLRAGIERYNAQADQLREVSHSAAGSGADGRRLTAGTAKSLTLKLPSHPFFSSFCSLS